MTTQDETNDQQDPSESSDASRAWGSNWRFSLLIGLLTLALFALWYDYKVARPAVEQAYERIAAKNHEMNSNAEFSRMTNADVQRVLKRSPSETILTGKYTIEAYRWSAGMPIELRGLNGDDSPGIGLKTHDYYAVYRKEGPQLAFVTQFKFDLDKEYFAEKVIVASANDSASAEEAMPEMVGVPGASGPGFGGPGGPDGGGPGGGRGFDPEAFFTARDADADGKLAGEEISERMRERLDAIDTDGDGAVSKEEFLAGMSRRRGQGGPGGEGEGAGRRQRPPLEESDDAPAAEAAPSDAAPAADAKEAPADTSAEESATEPAPEAAAKTSEETTKEESSSES